ncbi:c-type cytochrome [Geopsychrobacter electrodiphilus]|uniref:c-type cytochrome n=1 Tax=Geopsychrobacter electrodiphilus TaxID=225196 RepID=UPI0009FFAE44|nr:c-type cytochrome [Geopsychrobacter electrodiphilus]
MFNLRFTACLALVFFSLFLGACSKKEAGQKETGTAKVTESTETGSNQRGQEVYDGVCHSCHSTGVAGAPKLGDKAAWSGRIAKGVDALVQSALNGKGSMPPKGGERTLNEAEIRAAVNYMVDQAR